MASGIERRPCRPRISAPQFSTPIDHEEEQDANMTGVSVKTMISIMSLI